MVTLQSNELEWAPEEQTSSRLHSLLLLGGNRVCPHLARIVLLENPSTVLESYTCRDADGPDCPGPPIHGLQTVRCHSEQSAVLLAAQNLCRTADVVYLAQSGGPRLRPETQILVNQAAHQKTISPLSKAKYLFSVSVQFKIL